MVSDETSERATVGRLDRGLSAATFHDAPSETPCDALPAEGVATHPGGQDNCLDADRRSTPDSHIIPDGSGLTDSQRTEAQRNRTILLDALPYLLAGATQAETARAIRTNPPKLCRLLALSDLGLKASDADRCQQLLAGPLSTLAPQRAPGRESQWTLLCELPAVQQKLTHLYLSTIGASGEAMTHHRHTGSVALTLERFAEEPECPRELAAVLARGSQPKPFLQLLGKITTDHEQRVRGAKKMALHGATARRDQTIALEDGRRAMNRAGFIWSLDDMSSNHPFTFPQPDGTDGLSRQGLYAWDVASRAWLGFDLVARPREAYRAEDILRFLRRLMMTRGKPAVLRLERGIWHSNAIKGITLDDVPVQDGGTRPAMDADEKARLQDGLAAIGIQIQYVHNAHGKGEIEGGFRYLQTIVATYAPQYVCIGRHAGEFEAGAKAVRRVRAGSHRAVDLGFATMGQLGDAIERAMQFHNRRRVGRDHTPEEIWSKDTAAHPLPSLTEKDLAAFLPTIREATINGLRITCQVDGVPHDWRAEKFADLGNGYRVWIRFDPSEPTLGAAVYNREGDTLRNHLRLGEGHWITWARWEMPAPQLHYKGDAEVEAIDMEAHYGVGTRDEGLGIRKKQEASINKWVRTVGRITGLPGQPRVASASQRDGTGQVLDVSTAAQPQLAVRSTATASGQLAERSSSAPTSDRNQLAVRSTRMSSGAVLPASLRRLIEEEEEIHQ